MTFERYAIIMHMNPCVFMGVTTESDCSGMTCQDRRMMDSDIRMAKQKIDNALSAYDLSLEDRETIVTTQYPYWIVDQSVDLREFKTQLVENVEVTYSGSECNKMATVDFNVGLGPCEVFESAELVAPTGLCGVYPCDWTPASDGQLSVSTPAYNLALLNDDGQVSYPTEVTLRVKTSVPSTVVAIYENPCHCAAAKAVCSQCNDEVETSVCWKISADGVMRMRLPKCTCNRGLFMGYRFKVIQRGVSDEALDDAIVSIANSRQTIQKCAQCNYEAQGRLRRDLGIAEPDSKQSVQPWNYNNPFGIQTAGALMAWQTIAVKFGIPSVAGHF